MDDSPLFINQVFDRLLTDIALCELAPGQRIRQSALATRLQVSRQPISHALQLLKHEGLLQDAGRQGLEVAPINPDYMRLLYQARRPLEATAAGLAAQRVADGQASSEERASVEQALEEGLQKLRTNAPIAEVAWADYEFHTSVYRLSGNTVIEQMMNGRWAHIMRSLIVSNSYANLPHVWEEHTAIAHSVLKGAVVDASDLAGRHVQTAGVDLCKRLQAMSGPAS
ncbi:GntR family transcriptional regulator [Burkholderia sp. Ax-1719]|nr:GntR family transcriptional regulator [Burkholderia sp. Ax-1719]